jgi:hypothetical protein
MVSHRIKFFLLIFTFFGGTNWKDLLAPNGQTDLLQ